MKSPYEFKLCDDCKQPVIEVHTVAGERIVVNQQPALDGNIRLEGGVGKLWAEKLTPLEAFQAQENNELLYEEHPCAMEKPVSEHLDRPWNYERIVEEKEKFRARWAKQHAEGELEYSLSGKGLKKVNAILQRVAQGDNQVRYNLAYALFPETVSWRDPSTKQIRWWQADFLGWLWGGEKIDGGWKANPYQAREAEAVLQAYARLEREKLRERGQGELF